MSDFNPNGTYDPDRDVRDHRRLVRRLTSPGGPNGALWPLVATRRSGKTWALQGLKRSLNNARFLDLRPPELDTFMEDDFPEVEYLLLDEPGVCLQQHPGRFVDRCLELCRNRIKILLALTPVEWGYLRSADEYGARVSPKDLHFLPPLDATEAIQMAKRSPRSKKLLPTLPDHWTRNPFLLEVVLETLEDNPDLADDLDGLLWEAIDRSEHDYRYFSAQQDSALCEGQLDCLRGAARGEKHGEAYDLLQRCGLIEETDHGPRLSDPVLAWHLPPPLRIHHISDIHAGPKSAGAVDAKADTPVGRQLARAAGQEYIRDRYLSHVQGLSNQGKAPHLLVISGDLGEQGKPEEFEQLQGWLQELEACLACHPRLYGNDPRVLLVGGNHDVDWNQALGRADSHLRHRPFADAFPDYLRPRLELPPDQRELAHARYPDLGVEFALLGSSELGGEPDEDPVRAQLLALVEQLRARVAEAPGDTDIDQLRDTCARVDPGLVHRQDLNRLRQHPWKLPVRIAVLHHPLSPLPSTELAPYVGLLNAGEVKNALFEQGFCLVLHGHTHTAWYAAEQWPSHHGPKTLHIAGAASLGSSEIREANGFNSIEVECDRDPPRVTVYRHQYLGDQWQPEVVLGPFEPGQSCPVAVVK